jgi:hypothetical protein
MYGKWHPPSYQNHNCLTVTKISHESEMGLDQRSQHGFYYEESPCWELISHLIQNCPIFMQANNLMVCW